MYVKQIYTGCLNEAAYFIESNGEAVVIDPMRDTSVYLQLAQEQNATIKYIFETHLHSHFVSGHLDLGKATGATIVYGPGTEARFKFHSATDGETLKVGAISFEVLHTPGHTIESTSYLLRDEQGNPHSLFSGDTLSIEDAANYDLSSQTFSKEELASMLYDSIQNKIIPLPDELIIYPAHISSLSTSGKPGEEISSTLGIQKKTNHALQIQSKEEFIKSVTENIQDPLPYYNKNVKINKEGYQNLDDVKQKGLSPLTLPDFKRKMTEGCIVLDTRTATEFTNEFIPGSIFIGLEGHFAEWAAMLLSFEEPIIFIAPKGKEEETVIRLARVGFENAEGYLKGGFEDWKEAGEKIDMIVDIEADELAMDLPFDEALMVLDVRKPIEFAEGHIKDAVNIPLGDMVDLAQLASIEENQNIYVHCAAGYRSVIAASLLKRQGYHNLRNVLGGYNKIVEEKSIVIEKDASLLN
ncbi:MAG: rhodanese-like domain-containing protein [Ginsengibacter sp.]